MPLLLVVDADPVALERFGSALPSERYQLVAARSPDEALELIESRRPTLVFCTIDQPAFDGYALAERVGADRKLPRTPFVMVHDAESEPDQNRLDHTGARGVLQKPLDRETLSMVLGTLAPLPPEELDEQPGLSTGAGEREAGTGVGEPRAKQVIAEAASHSERDVATSSHPSDAGARRVPPAFEAAVMRAVAQSLGVDPALLQEAAAAERSVPADGAARATQHEPQTLGPSDAGRTRAGSDELRPAGAPERPSVYQSENVRVFVSAGAERESRVAREGRETQAERRSEPDREAHPPREGHLDKPDEPRLGGKSAADFERVLRRMVQRAVARELDAWVDEVAARVRRRLLPEMEAMLDELWKRMVEKGRNSGR